MNTYRTRRRSPEERHCNVFTQAAGADRPFPNKPVHHRRLFNPKMHDSPELHGFEKITISAQPRGPLSSQEYYPRKDRLPNREVQMARSIHAKELILQEKLWRAEDKIRQKIQKDAAAAAAAEEEEEEEEKHDRGQVKSGKALKKTRLREPARSREMLKHERRPEDVKQLRKTQNQTNNDMIRKTHEEQKAIWGGRETEDVQLKRKGNKDPHESTAHVHKVSRDRRKVEAEQSKTSRNYDIWTRETTYKVRKKVSSSHDDDDDMTHRSQQKAVYRLKATETHRGSRSKISEESSLPPVSSPSRSSAAQQGELRLTGGTRAGLLPCRICNRKFSHERIEKHVQVCQKVQQSQRQVFNSYANRTKGSAIEEFWRNHSRSKTPEVLKKKKQTQNQKMNTRTLH
ncbi:hypothetical protein PAMA_003738 [Pampus argenteus]